MKQKIVCITFILCIFLNTTSVIASNNRVIYSFDQLTDTRGSITLDWLKDSHENIRILSYYPVEEGVLEVNYVTGTDLQNNEMTIITQLPTRIILKEQGIKEAKLSDLPEDKIDKYNILNLYDRGVISGYTDGTFKPNYLVSRAEFATMIVLAARYEKNNLASIFKDVSNDYWGKQFIMTLAEKKILFGKGDKLFDPNGDITISEVLAVIDRTFQVYGDYDYKNPNIEHWSADNYKSLARAGIIKEEDDFYYPYKPTMKATRLQCATLLSRVLQNIYSTN